MNFLNEIKLLQIHLFTRELFAFSLKIYVRSDKQSVMNVKRTKRFNKTIF